MSFNGLLTLVVDYQNPDTLYTIIWPGDSRIRRSFDGGNNWSNGYDPTYGEDAHPNKPLEMNPVNPKSLYTGGYNLYKSINRADTFTQIPVPSYIDTDEIMGSICVAPSDTFVIYIAYSNPRWWGSVKLIKTINGGSTWDSISNSLEVLNVLGITDIEVSPQDPDSVWFSLGGFDYQTPDSLVNRHVYFSHNGGTSWVNISAGLPDLPVNCIKYNPGSNGGLFAATDRGVYYYDNDLSHWIPFNTGLPWCIVTDLEVNDSLQLIKASTFGRGIYESDISCHYDENPLIISTNTTWRNDTIMDRSILVDSLVTFTIESRVAFPTVAKIMVKCGGKLIVDGGTLTNACFRNWLGIEVWGNSSVSQSPVTNQGFVWLNNGAVLENSRIGITTCKKDSYGNIIWSTTGGIIISDSAVFRNNYKAIEFLSYRNRQISSFKRTIFETTRIYIDAYNWYPSYFVSLYDVSGVTFKGCTFQNTTVNSTIPNSTKGVGIYSIDAQYSVDTYCTSQITPCPVSAQSPSIFTGLCYGIKSLNYESGKTVSLNKASFSNNSMGTYLSVVDYATITSNTYTIPNTGSFTPPGVDTCYGLYLDRCTGYQVEENIFRPFTANINNLSVGLIVNNSGTDMNEIYNNQFDTLKYGILAQDENRSSDGQTGLVLRCNDHHNNKYDKVVSLSDPYQTDWGIALYQGDSLSQSGPAANTFSPQHNSSGAWDIDNYGARFKYYHHTEQQGDPRLEPDWYSNVTKRAVDSIYSKQICCPSNLTTGGGAPDDLKQEILTESTIIDIKESQLSALIDGGNTEILNTEILNSVPPEALQLREQLLSESPYLSDTSMQSAIYKENVLPNEMIRDILIANPHSATSDKVLEELNNRFVPMPDSMMAEILAGEEIISAKETLETELTSHKVRHSQALYNLIRYYRNDTINNSSQDTLINLLQNQPDLPLKYQLAFEYLQTRDTNNLNNTLAYIPATYNLNQQQSNIHEDYLTYFSIMKNLIKNSKNIFTMDSTLLPAIYNLYSNGDDPVKSYARNILIARGVITCHEPILLPDELKSTDRITRYKTSWFLKKSYMKLFPNPSRKYVIIEYNLQEKYSDKNEVILLITNLRGNPVLRRMLMKRQDQELINTSGLIPGTYICSLRVNGKILESKKFVMIE